MKADLPGLGGGAGSGSRRARIVSRISTLAVTALFLLAPACGWGGAALYYATRPKPPGPGTTKDVTGVAFKGPVRGGVVKAYALDPTTGDKTGGALGSATTDDAGGFKLAIPRSHSAALLLEVESGTYLDEATGQDVEITADTALYLSLPDASGIHDLSVTPLTTMAVELARGQVASRGLEAAIRNSHKQVGHLFGVGDVARDRPRDLLREGASAVDNGAKYAMVIAGLAQRAMEIDGATPAEVRATDLVKALARDLSDGTLDGADSQGVVKVRLGGPDLGDKAATQELAAAMDTFAQQTFAQRKTNSAAQLPSGLTGSDLGQAGRSLPAAPNVSSVNPATVVVGTAQTITIRGAGFATSGSVAVKFGDVQASANVKSATELTVSLPAGLGVGTYDITVVNPSVAGLPALEGRLVRGLTVSATVGTGGGGAASRFQVSTKHGNVETVDVGFSLTILAQDGQGKTVTDYSGAHNVTFFSNATSSPSGEKPVIPSQQLTLVFTAGAAVTSEDFRLYNAAETPTITATEPGGPTGTSAGITVTAGTAAAFAVATEHGGTEKADTKFSLTVTVLDAFGNIASGYAGAKDINFSLTTSPGPSLGPSPDRNLQTVPVSESVTFSAGVGTTAKSFQFVATFGRYRVTAASPTASGTTGDVEVTPGAPAKFQLAPTSSVIAGNGFDLTATVLDAHDNVATSYQGTHTIKFSSTATVAPDGTAPTIPALLDIAFDKGLGTTTGAPFRFVNAGEQPTFTATETGAGPGAVDLTGTSQPLAVQPSTAVELVVSGFPDPVTAGVAGSVTVEAKDGFGNRATGYRGPVAFTSSDPHAQKILPANYNFTAQDAGVHAFPGAVTLKTAGEHSITATDTVTATITGTQSGITAEPAAAASLVVSGFPDPVTAGVAGGVTVEARDAFGNRATGYKGTIAFTASDPHAQKVLPAEYTFTAVDAGVKAFDGVGAGQQVKLATVGERSVTATDTAANSIAGTQSAITVNPGPFDHYTIAAASATGSTLGGLTLSIRAEDAFGNSVPNHVAATPLTVAQNGGTASTISYPATAGVTDNGGGTATIAAGTAFSAGGVFTFKVKDATAEGPVTFTVAPQGGAAGAPTQAVTFKVPPTVTGLARFTDENKNAVLDAGDKLVVGFTENVAVSGAGATDFALPVTGNSLGAAATVAAGPGAKEVTITLGAGAVFKTRGTFSPSKTVANDPSGIDVAATLAAGAIRSATTGLDAASGSSVDLFPAFVDSGQSLGSSNTRAIALADLDGDGDLDLVEGNSGANKVWKNDGAGVFTDSGQSLGSSNTYALALGDVDGDGDLDLVEGNFGEANKVWQNDGGGVFTDSGQSLGSSYTQAIALADVDGDGDLDLVEGIYNQANKVWKNDGAGVFADSGQSLGSSVTQAIALADVDGDGDLDLVEGNSGQANKVWKNNGAGVFADSGQALGSSDTYALALADVDGDGDLDLVEGNLGQANKVWKNDGAGVFTDSGQSLGLRETSAIALADVDGDGDLDLVEGNSFNQANKVWKNDGAGVFTDSGQALGSSSTLDLALADVDGDGDLDLVEGNGSFPGQANKVWLGSLAGTWGTAGFQDSGQSLGSSDTRTIALGDVDRDGDLDMVEGNYNQANKVWKNNGGGTFTGSVQSLGSSSTYALVLGDVDRDGDLDMVEGNTGANTVWKNDGAGVFADSLQSLGSSDTRAIALADVDGDGDLDLVEGNYGQANKVWKNDGAGVFADSLQSLGASYTQAIALADVDGDGDLDILEGNDGANKVWKNDGTGAFTDSGQSLGLGLTHALALADVDGDGDPDMVEGNTGANTVWKNNGAGTFTDSGQSLGSSDTYAITLADVDGDGDLDMVESNYNGIAKVWENDGTGAFTDTGQNLGSGRAYANGLGDVDGDGDLDLVVGNGNNDANKVWLNK